MKQKIENLDISLGAKLLTVADSNRNQRETDHILAVMN